MIVTWPKNTAGLSEELENERLNKAALDKNLRTKESELKDTVAKLEDVTK